VKAYFGGREPLTNCQESCCLRITTTPSSDRPPRLGCFFSCLLCQKYGFAKVGVFFFFFVFLEVLLCLTASIMMILMIMMMDERKNQYLYKP
jgi:hypothetical protein